MMFTLAQLRAAVGLSVTTCRHWQDTLPTLGARTGRAARFSFGDLVALSVLRCAVDDVGLKISQFSQSAAALFEKCNALRWVGDTHMYVVTGPVRDDMQEPSRRGVVAHRVSIVQADVSGSIECASVVIPLDPIAERLRSLLFSALGPVEDRQASLPLPPVPLLERLREPRVIQTPVGQAPDVGKRPRRRSRGSRNIA